MKVIPIISTVIPRGVDVVQPPPPPDPLLLEGRESDSEFAYPSAYRPKPVEDQIDVLKGFFYDLRAADLRYAAMPLPHGAEARFAIPRVAAIAQDYCEAVQKVASLLASSLGAGFRNACEGVIGPKFLRQAKIAADAWRMVEERQSGDILIVPAQFGLRHRGRSVAEARETMAEDSLATLEFGLGPFEVGIMLLTHPERLAGMTDLGIDCAGSEYSRGATWRFDWAMYFHTSHIPNPPKDVLTLNAYWENGACRDTGSASAFVARTPCAELSL